MRSSIFVLFASLSLLACSSTVASAPSPSGATACGAAQCEAGQYCSNGICENGCLSDQNCASNQTCEKPAGETTGACANKSTPTTDGGTDSAPTSGIDVTAMCKKILASISECSGPFNQAACEQQYKLAGDRGCGKWLPDLAAFVRDHSQPFYCFSGYPAIANDTTEGAAVGAACPRSVTTPACYGISCERFSDCTTGTDCNTTTGKCFESSATMCAGLPCARFSDCPSGHTCNEAIGVCVKG